MNRIPEGQIRNPFLPWFNPITRRWDSPVYNLRQQRLLVKEARRLNLTDVLPSGPKTPPEFANTFLDAWREMGVERKRTELGRIIWAGVYKKKLNPFGQARFVEGKMDEEKRKAREVVEGLERWGPYSGRIAMFKGTLAQRRAPAREAEIKARMDGMAKRVEAWKKVCSLPWSFESEKLRLADKLAFFYCWFTGKESGEGKGSAYFTFLDDNFFLIKGSVLLL